jgi:hypothetical protein
MAVMWLVGKLLAAYFKRLELAASRPINLSCLESIKKFHAAVIWRKVQQLPPTGKINYSSRNMQQ